MHMLMDKLASREKIHTNILVLFARMKKVLTKECAKNSAMDGSMKNTE